MLVERQAEGRPQAVDVFTPSSFPRWNYVSRGLENFERRLDNALKVPQQLVSLSGPSKAGKTVLVEQVVGRDKLIVVPGSILEAPEDLWTEVLDQFEVPLTREEIAGDGVDLEGRVEAKAEVKVPLLKGGGGAQGGIRKRRDRAVHKTFGRGGFRQAVQALANSGYIVLIDDFHYIPKKSQSPIVRQCKAAAESGVALCFVTVPHRAEDVLRANSELRGRVFCLDLSYWREKDLVEIGRKGFTALNVTVPDPVLSRFAKESAGSPQLMQAICLSACFHSGIEESLDEEKTLEPRFRALDSILQETAFTAMFSDLISALKKGPMQRGTERRLFALHGGGSGDVYECVLRALAADPPSLHFDYTNIKQRVASVCVWLKKADDLPKGGAIIHALKQMNKIARDQRPEERILEWTREGGGGRLDIVDPYFLFYLRWSNQM